MGNFIIGGILLLCLAAAAYSLYRSKKKGKCCGCSGCDAAKTCGQHDENIAGEL